MSHFEFSLVSQNGKKLTGVLLSNKHLSDDKRSKSKVREIQCKPIHAISAIRYGDEVSVTLKSNYPFCEKRFSIPIKQLWRLGRTQKLRKTVYLGDIHRLEIRRYY